MELKLIIRFTWMRVRYVPANDSVLASEQKMELDTAPEPKRVALILREVCACALSHITLFDHFTFRTQPVSYQHKSHSAVRRQYTNCCGLPGALLHKQHTTVYHYLPSISTLSVLRAPLIGFSWILYRHHSASHKGCSQKCWWKRHPHKILKSPLSQPLLRAMNPWEPILYSEWSRMWCIQWPYSSVARQRTPHLYQHLVKEYYWAYRHIETPL